MRVGGAIELFLYQFISQLDEDRVVDPASLKCLVDAGASLTIVSETKGTPLDCLCRHSDGVNDLFNCLLRIALGVLRRKKEYLLKRTLQTGSATFLEVGFLIN